MSSSRPADRGIRGRAWTLRARLLAMLMLVLAAVCLTVGVTTAIVVRDNLIDQTDQRLDGARDRVVREAVDRYGPRRGDPPAFLGAQGLGPGTLGASIEDGQVIEAGLLPASPGPPEALAANASAVRSPGQLPLGEVRGSLVV